MISNNVETGQLTRGAIGAIASVVKNPWERRPRGLFVPKTLEQILRLTLCLSKQNSNRHIGKIT